MTGAFDIIIYGELAEKMRKLTRNFEITYFAQNIL